MQMRGVRRGGCNTDMGASTTKLKRDWFGGINQLPDRSKINFETEYALLVNGRVRDNSVTPIAGPLDITAGLPTNATVQGIYGIGRFLLVFAGGSAYVKDYSAAEPSWYAIAGFAMSTTEPKIYAEAIPASTVNFIRTATQDNNFKSPVALTGLRNSSPQAIICMDGVSQPWLIFPDGSARVTQDFGDWVFDTAAEYVPIAKMPFYYNGILYCVGPDERGVFNQIFRSVTGRPCDFQIIVTTTGARPASATEATYGAPALAERVDFDEITFIGPINTADGSFLVTTAQNSYIVTPDFDNTICSEPTFVKQYLFSIGAVNDESVTDVLGDTTLIHARGIRSFNGVNQLRFEGKYAPFNIRVNRLIENQIQTICAATTWENYAVYSVNTAHGYGILWYDMLLSQFVSLDLYDNQYPFIQFAAVTVGTINKIFALSNDGRVVELLAGTRQRCVVQLADLVAGDDNLLISLDEVSALFSYGETAGYAEVSYTLDGRFIGAEASALPAADLAPSAGVIPVSGQLVVSADSTTPLIFRLKQLVGLGARVSVAISWNTDARLVETTISTTAQGPRTKREADSFFVEPLKIILIGSDAALGSEPAALNLAIKRENPDYVVGLGSHTFLGTANDVRLRLVQHWDNLYALGRFFASPGPGEIDTSNGEPFFQYVRQGVGRYSYLELGGFARVYLLNSGYNSAGVQVEPDNLNEATIGESLQSVWLQDQIASSPRLFNFVVLGSPPRSSTAAQQSALDTIPFAATGVDAVFSGLGNYERIESEQRVVYVNAGTGGNPAIAFTTPARSDSAVRLTDLGYVRLTLRPLSALIEFVDADGEVRDRRLL